MKYKMIVTDLDDTLLNSEKKISPIDLQAIMKVHLSSLISYVEEMKNG